MLIWLLLKEKLCSLLFPLIVSRFKTWLLLRSKFGFWRYEYQHTKGVCLFIANCVTEFETVFRGLIFWLLLFKLKYSPNISVVPDVLGFWG